LYQGATKPLNVHKGQLPRDKTEIKGKTSEPAVALPPKQCKKIM
jgi:hypothetical protein